MEKSQNINETEFLDLLPELVFDLDVNLNITALNHACEKVLGYSKDELFHKKVALEEFIVPEDLQKLKNSLKNNFSGKHVSGNSYRFLKKNKEEVILEIYNSIIKNDQEIVGLRCIAIDITEKERKHQELTNKEKHYRHIFHNFPLPYQALNKDGVIIDVNPTWEQIMGYTRDEIIGRQFSDIITEEEREKFKHAFAIFKEKGQSSNIQFDIIKKDGNIINANYHGKIEKSDNNDYIRSHCVFTDITLQRKAEDTLIKSENRLRELNATKDKFFSIIAHDLKNPFNDLIGFTQLLALNIDKYDKNKIEQFAHIIHQSSKLAYNLLENLLDWSRSQTGTLKFKPEKFAVNKIIDENINLLESTAKNKDIKITSEVESNVLAFADINMTRTIVRNLISNAIKYTEQGGNIFIRSNCADHCQISITDTGIGMSTDNLDKIFKLDESFSTMGTGREKGTGLGLILCKEFVEKNGGEIWVKSELNKGSIFTFTLPLPE